MAFGEVDEIASGGYYSLMQGYQTKLKAPENTGAFFDYFLIHYATWGFPVILINASITFGI